MDYCAFFILFKNAASNWCLVCPFCGKVKPDEMGIFLCVELESILVRKHKYEQNVALLHHFVQVIF